MKTSARSDKDLPVWQKDIALAKLVDAAEPDALLILAIEPESGRDADAAPTFRLIEDRRRMLNTLRRKLAARP